MNIVTSSEPGSRAARVVYDNAARGNSFTDASLSQLVEALELAASDEACSVLRLEMAGEHFCGGWDTGSFGDLSRAGVAEVAEALRTSDRLLERIRALPVPVVAAVRGRVIGFGAGLLAAVHLPVAASDVRLSLPEVRFGFAPAGVGHTFAQNLPRAQAYAMLTGSQTASATQLHAWGLVARVVGDSSLDAEVDELVETLTAIPGRALRAVVEVVETSRATGDPDTAFLASARTIVDVPKETG